MNYRCLPFVFFIAKSIHVVHGFAAISIPVNIFQPSVDQSCLINGIASLKPRKERGASIFVKSTSPEDLSIVSELLAFETISKGKIQFFQNMERIKKQQDFKMQLSHRLDANKFALKAIRERCFAIPESLDQHLSFQEMSYNRRLIWNNDGIRSRIEKAVKVTQQLSEIQTPWNNHNLAIAPDAHMLYHFMLSAHDEDMDKNNRFGIVVGFCEVMTICSPYGEIVPCIMNLVVHPIHRRKGIGMRLLNNAIRRIRLDIYRQKWMSDLGYCDTFNSSSSSILPYKKVALYVNSENLAAVKLYEKLGFCVRKTESNMLYMEVELDNI